MQKIRYAAVLTEVNMIKRVGDHFFLIILYRQRSNAGGGAIILGKSGDALLSLHIME